MCTFTYILVRYKFWINVFFCLYVLFSWIDCSSTSNYNTRNRISMQGGYGRQLACYFDAKLLSTVHLSSTLVRHWKKYWFADSFVKTQVFPIGGFQFAPTNNQRTSWFHSVHYWNTIRKMEQKNSVTVFSLYTLFTLILSILRYEPIC